MLFSKAPSAAEAAASFTRWKRFQRSSMLLWVLQPTVWDPIFSCQVQKCQRDVKHLDQAGVSCSCLRKGTFLCKGHL